MLSPFFNPRGVAIVGASRDLQKLGYGVVRNLIDCHYRGKIYPVNPGAREILQHRCYASINDVPDPVDLAIVIVPAPVTAKIVDQCGERGIKHVVVVSGGFGEIGTEGKTREEELANVIKKHGMRLLGPNCIGTIDTHTPINTTFVTGMPQLGDIGFLSQSGAMVAAVIDWARGAGVGFSRIVSLGNQVDVGETEMLAAMADDSQTRVITAYIEGVADGRAFMKTAEETARHKPVVVLKVGHGESGAQAVASHTGALAGSAEAYDAAFKHSGILRASSMEELFDWARGLAWQPLPEGKQVAVLTNAGGPGILAVDALEAAGLQLAPLTEETRTYLAPRLPDAASLKNPVDILAGSGPGTCAIALDALLSDPTVDSAIVIQAPQDWFLPASLAEVIGEVAAVHHKPVLASIMGLASVDQASAILHQKRIPKCAFPERAASALAAMIARKEWLETPLEKPVQFSDINHAVAKEAFNRGHFFHLMKAYGIPLPPTQKALSKNEALEFAEVIGYPVALKLLSPEITHKSDVGAVVLNLDNEKALATAYERIIDKTHAVQPGAIIDGILVQKMLTGGQEIIVGIRRDPQFGPIILVGSGGIDVELIGDVAMGIAPLTNSQAERMLDSTQAAIRLKGWRGSPSADRNAVLDVMMRMSQIACDFSEISELEINPVYVLSEGQGAFAVDVRGGMQYVHK